MWDVQRRFTSYPLGPGFWRGLPAKSGSTREDQRSHYSYNEIIMNGAQRPHHKNIYCIIYSASPLVQGERTHINFQPRSSPPHSGSCLLLKAEAHVFFHSFSFVAFFSPLDVAQRASIWAFESTHSGFGIEDELQHFFF